MPPLPNREKSFEVLTAVARQSLEDVRKHWRAKQRFPTVLLAWPGDPTSRYEIVHMAVPKEVTSFRAAVDLTEKTKAYALFLFEELEDRVLLLVETRQGTLAISVPIEQHGDVRVLGKEQETRDTESLGVLWRKGGSVN